MAARLKELYLNTVVPSLTKEFGYTNRMAVPKIEKIFDQHRYGRSDTECKIDRWRGERADGHRRPASDYHQGAEIDCGVKLRENMPIGAAVYAARDRMYEFLDRLVNVSHLASAISGACRRSRSTGVGTTRWA